GMVSRYFVYKQALLEEAGRLVQAHVLREKEDIFYLRFQELHDVVRTNHMDHQLISQRKGAFRSYQALATPPGSHVGWRGGRRGIRLAGRRGGRESQPAYPGWTADSRAWNSGVRRDPALAGAPERYWAPHGRSARPRLLLGRGEGGGLQVRVYGGCLRGL